MCRIALTLTLFFTMLVSHQGYAQGFKFKRKTIQPGIHTIELKSSTGTVRTVPLLKQKNENVMEVERAALLELPMECLALPTDIAGGEFVEPGQRIREQTRAIKAALKLAGKIISPLSEKAEFLQEFVDRVPCLHPETRREIAFKDFLKYYVQENGYIADGYFQGSELDSDPVGVLLRLLLFDRWVLNEAKIIRGDDDNWYSMEDCLKGRFKSHYSHLALESLKNALKFQGEAKEYPLFRIASKSKAYTAAIVSYLNTCLFIVEANRNHLLRTNLTATCFERIRGTALKAKVVAHYRSPSKISVVSELTRF